MGGGVMGGVGKLARTRHTSLSLRYHPFTPSSRPPQRQRKEQERKARADTEIEAALKRFSEQLRVNQEHMSMMLEQLSKPQVRVERHGGASSRQLDTGASWRPSSGLLLHYYPCHPFSFTTLPPPPYPTPPTTTPAGRRGRCGPPGLHGLLDRAPCHRRSRIHSPQRRVVAGEAGRGPAGTQGSVTACCKHNCRCHGAVCFRRHILARCHVPRIHDGAGGGNGNCGAEGTGGAAIAHTCRRTRAPRAKGRCWPRSPRRHGGAGGHS